jgi:hypothetical protein
MVSPVPSPAFRTLPSVVPAVLAAVMALPAGAQDTVRVLDRAVAPAAIAPERVQPAAAAPARQVATTTVEAATVSRLQRTVLEGSPLLRLSPEARPDTLRRQGAVQLREDEVLLAVTGDRPAVLVDPERYGLPGGTAGAGGEDEPNLLPWEWVAMDGDRTEAVNFRPVFAVVEPLRYRRDEGLFRARILLGLVEVGRPGVSRPLATAVGIRVLSTDADGVEPEVVRLERTNELVADVEVRARSPLDSVRMEFRPAALSEGGVEAWVPVRPGLAVELSPRRIQGFGLEAADIRVTLLGRSPAQSVTVSLASAYGAVDGGEVEIGTSGTARARVRSRSLGWDTITAVGVGLDATPVPVRYLFPWLFLGATILGGGAGATLRVLQGQGAEGERESAGAVRPSALLGGALLGIVVAVATFVLGLDLVGVDPTAIPFTEGAAFGVAAVAAWFGVRAPRVG